MYSLANCIFLILLNLVVIKCGTKAPSSDYSTCQQQSLDTLATSNAACQQLDTSKTGACSLAQPVLQPLVVEPCNSTTFAGRKKRSSSSSSCNHCPLVYWKYYSKILKQIVSVTPRLVRGLRSGDIQYKLGIALKKPCNYTGIQICVGEYGYITCNRGKWSISRVCDPNTACVQYEEKVPVTVKPVKYYHSSSSSEHEIKRKKEIKFIKIQKANCMPLVAIGGRKQLKLGKLNFNFFY